MSPWLLVARWSAVSGRASTADAYATGERRIGIRKRSALGERWRASRLRPGAARSTVHTVEIKSSTRNGQLPKAVTGHVLAAARDS